MITSALDKIIKYLKSEDVEMKQLGITIAEEKLTPGELDDLLAEHIQFPYFYKYIYDRENDRYRVQLAEQPFYTSNSQWTTAPVNYTVTTNTATIGGYTYINV